MKRFIMGAAAVSALAIAGIARAVTTDWTILNAVEIGDVTSSEYSVDAGRPKTRETRVEFEGPALSFLMNALPQVLDGETSTHLTHDRMLEIVREDKSISIDCKNAEYDQGRLSPLKNGTKCSIVITKGPRAG